MEHAETCSRRYSSQWQMVALWEMYLRDRLFMRWHTRHYQQSIPILKLQHQTIATRSSERRLLSHDAYWQHPVCCKWTGTHSTVSLFSYWSIQNTNMGRNQNQNSFATNSNGSSRRCIEYIPRFDPANRIQRCILYRSRFRPYSKCCLLHLYQCRRDTCRCTCVKTVGGRWALRKKSKESDSRSMLMRTARIMQCRSKK